MPIWVNEQGLASGSVGPFHFPSCQSGRFGLENYSNPKTEIEKLYETETVISFYVTSYLLEEPVIDPYAIKCKRVKIVELMTRSTNPWKGRVNTEKQ